MVSPAVEAAKREAARRAEYDAANRRRGMPEWRPYHPRVNGFTVLASDEKEVVYSAESLERIKRCGGVVVNGGRGIVPADVDEYADGFGAEIGEDGAADKLRSWAVSAAYDHGVFRGLTREDWVGAALRIKNG